MEEIQPNNRRIKVAKVIWWIPHYRAAVFRRLCQNPHLDFVIFAGNNTQVFDKAKVASATDAGNAKGINWHQVNSRRLKWRPFRDYEWQPEAVWRIWKNDYDVVITLGNKSLSNWIIRVLCKLKRTPLIEWTMGVRGPESGLKWAVRKFYLRWAKAFLIYGDLARDFFVEQGFKESEVFVVRNSLDHDKQIQVRTSIKPEEIRETRRQFGVVSNEDRLVFHSGRLEKFKNIAILISAISKLKQQGKRVILVLIGTGQQEETLRKQVERENVVEEVVFFGPCYDEEVLGKIISASDLCVSPGDTGLLVMHTLVYGTPILARDNTAYLHGPEIEAIIPGKTGDFFRDGDLNDLVAKMQDWLFPCPLKEELSEACMKAIDTTYTPEYQERIILKAIDSVLPADKRIPISE